MNNAEAIQIASDTLSSILTTTAQFSEPLPSVVVPVIAGDLIYSGALKDYITNAFSTEIADDYSRDILFKTVISGSLVWVTQLFINGNVGVVSSMLNSFITFSASDGITTFILPSQK